MTTYEQELIEGKDKRLPTVKELMYSLTWQHDHLLNDPVTTRKYCASIVYGQQDLTINSSEFDGDDDGQPAPNPDLYNVMTDNGKLLLILWRVQEISQQNCCAKKLHTYVGLEVSTGKIQIITKSVFQRVCSDYGGGSSFDTPTIISDSDITLKQILTRNPAWIASLMLEENLDLAIKMLDE